MVYRSSLFMLLAGISIVLTACQTSQQPRPSAATGAASQESTITGRGSWRSDADPRWNGQATVEILPIQSDGKVAGYLTFGGSNCAPRGPLSGNRDQSGEYDLTAQMGNQCGEVKIKRVRLEGDKFKWTYNAGSDWGDIKLGDYDPYVP